MAALRSLGILDTGSEDRFDRITRIASTAFRAPIAFVSLLDSDPSAGPSTIRARVPGSAPCASSTGCRAGWRARTWPCSTTWAGWWRPSSTAGSCRGSSPPSTTAAGTSVACSSGTSSSCAIDADIVGIDEHGVITFANPSAEALLGWPAGSLVGRDLHETAHHHRPDGRPYERASCPTVRTLGEGVAHRAEGEWLWRADGHGFPAEIGSSPKIDGGRVVGAVVTFHDTSERDAVRALKAEFVALVSHELRTPLTSVSGALRLLAAGVAGELPPEAKELVDAAEANSSRLIRLVNDILDLERLQQHRFELALDTVSAEAVVRATLDAVGGMAREAQVALEPAVIADVALVADFGRLVQVLTNLVGNAVKFSEPGATVPISGEMPKAGEVRFRVADSGRGIPADMLESIFEPFAQVDASDARRHGGTGLGLAISARLVEAHRGRISVDSDPGRGSTFDVVLPAGGATGAGGAG